MYPVLTYSILYKTTFFSLCLVLRNLFFYYLKMSYTHIICFDESIPYSHLSNFSSIFFLTFYSQRHVFPHRQTPSLLVLPDVTWVWIHLLEYGLSISVHVPKETQLSLATGVISGEWILTHELLPHTYWDFVCLFLKQIL